MAVRLVQGTLAGSGGGTGERDAGLLGRISTMRESIAISEIFGPTVQGEGPLIGQPTVFVRTGGCDYRCVWCDTLYAVLPEHRSEWVLMKPTEIERRIDELASTIRFWSLYQAAIRPCSRWRRSLNSVTPKG